MATETFTLSTLIISLVAGILLGLTIAWMLDNEIIEEIVRKIRREPKITGYDYYAEMMELKEMEEREREAREE